MFMRLKRILVKMGKDLIKTIAVGRAHESTDSIVFRVHGQIKAGHSQ